MNNKALIGLIAIMILGLLVAGCAVTDMTGSTTAELDEDIVQQPEAEEQETAEQEQQPEQQTTAEPAATETEDDMYNIECHENSDCGEIIYGETYCFQNGITIPVTKPTCMNPGSIKSYCRNEMKDEVKMCIVGKEVCRSGKCFVLAELPCEDSDGGRNYEEAGTVFDAELIEYKDNCKDKYHVIEYYCIGGDKGIARSEERYCTGGKCVTGACVK